MPYLVIDDFKQGMDRRKKRISGVPGQLWTGINCHITRGGEVERRKKFDTRYSLPANTFGLAEVNDQLYVFGSVSTPAGLPAGINYQRLQHTDGTTAMSRILDVDKYNNLLYVIAEFTDGSIFHYYDGARVTSWDAIAASVSSNNAVASALADRIDLQSAYNASSSTNVVTITAATAGTPYTITASTTNGGSTNDQTITLLETQANVPAVAEVLSSFSFSITGGTNNPGVNTVSSITVDGVEILGGTVDWITSNTETAEDIADQATSYTSTPEYTVSSDGPTVTITALSGTGATPNGFTVAVITNGDVTISPTGGSMAGGVTAVTAVAQVYTATIGGTFEAEDTFTVTLDGVDYSVTGAGAGTGITALTFDKKIYSVTGSLLYFTALSAPTTWGSGTGSGFINMANESGNNEDLTGTREYQGNMAIFSRNSIRIWDIDVDPDLNAKISTVQNTGTRSINSVVPYGNIDVFYLDETGIRSLRARDSSNAPSVNDVGVAIDAFVKEYLATLTDLQVQSATALIEPEAGRYWLGVGQRIFVFSYFPGSKINAWTYYDVSDANEADTNDIDALVRVDDAVYMRCGDTVFLYGGTTGVVYPDDDEIPATLELPFMSAGSPATLKAITGFDIGLEGVWDCKLLPDPKRESVELDIGVIYENTFSELKHAIQMPASLFALKLTCSKAGYASVSKAIVHYDGEEAT